jgi:hypothetical protein
VTEDGHSVAQDFVRTPVFLKKNHAVALQGTHFHLTDIPRAALEDDLALGLISYAINRAEYPSSMNRMPSLSCKRHENSNLMHHS